jgi:hypothetical protein
VPDIKCTVSSCFFWKDDVCGAPAIEVAPRRGTNSAFSDAGEIGAAHGSAVQRSEETQCVTFRPRGTEKARPDQAERGEPRRGSQQVRR